ncbi:MAG: 30S ribosomal protein S8 [Candidatus Margulisiibacteriota bacterium]
MDSIADMLNRVNNALGVRKEGVDLPHSRVKEEIAKILLAEGYISKLEPLTRMNRKFIRLGLKYTAKGRSVIEGMKRVSTSGKRHYVAATKVPRVRSGFGTAIISTSKGLMTDAAARQAKLGGEVLCFIW